MQDNLKQIESKIDSNKNLQLEEKEILDFIKEEKNLKDLGNTLKNIMKNSPDGFANFSQTLKLISESILDKGSHDLEQIKILIFIKEQLAYQFPELEQKIISLLEQKKLDKNIDQELNISLRDTIYNLKALGVNPKTTPNWKLLFETIKKPQDLFNITTENLNNYLPLSNEVPQDNLPYILSNFQSLIAQHLSLNPGYESFIGLNGRATGLNLQKTRDGNLYRQNILKSLNQIDKKKGLNEKIDFALKSSDLFSLWLKKEISQTKTPETRQQKLNQIFSNFNPQQIKQLLIFMDKEDKSGTNTFLGSFKDVVLHVHLQKIDGYMTTVEGDVILNYQGMKYLTPLVNQYGSEQFGLLIKNSKIIHDFYAQAQKWGFSTKIPRQDIVNFYQKYQKQTEKLERIKLKSYKEQANTISTFGGREMRIVAVGEARAKIGKAEAETYTYLCEEYVSLLLKDPANRGKKITAPKELGELSLDFTKGNKPEDIVRDSFGETLSDQWNIFVNNIKNDQQAAFGSLCGMVGGCVLAGMSTFSGNIWASSAAFTAGIRLGNGIGQEVWNTGETIFGASSKGSNQIDDFGDSFLRGIGTHEFKRDQSGEFIRGKDGKVKQEFIGLDKFFTNLGFDYLSTVTTFGISKGLSGVINKIGAIKGIGTGLKFGFEELVLENFFVDIPMNVLQTGFGTFTGIDSKIKKGQTVLGNKEGVNSQKTYQSGSLTDMLEAMKDAMQENLSFENLSQTFFSTVVYGGLLEGGQVAVAKVNTQFPSTQITDFENTSKAAATALVALKNFMEVNNLNFDVNGKCIDVKTKKTLSETDPKIKKLMEHLQTLQSVQKTNLIALEAINQTHKTMLKDPSGKSGLLFRLGLISKTNTPLNILEKKLNICDQKIEKAKKKGDSQTVSHLEQLKADYLKAKGVLSQTSDGLSDIGSVDLNQDLNKKERETQEDNITKPTHIEKRKYYDQIPIEADKYYRVTGMSEIEAVIASGKLESPQESFYDRGILTKIEENSNYTMEELEKLNGIHNDKIRDLYTEFVVQPMKAQGKMVLMPRAKSNHGDVAFAKEILYYDVHNQSSRYYGAPVIVGTNSSKFEAGHHGTYRNKFNTEIESGKPVVLREGFDANNFEYWFHNNEGRYKLSYEELKNQHLKKQQYFQGKESKFGLSEVQARQNSQFVDQILSNINTNNQTEQLQLLKEKISKQYQEATGKQLDLDTRHLLSILNAHQQDGRLGDLNFGELKKKVEILNQTITDPELRRFLLEAGFCGQDGGKPDFSSRFEQEHFSWERKNKGGKNEINDDPAKNDQALFERLKAKRYNESFENLNLDNISECRFLLTTLFDQNGNLKSTEALNYRGYNAPSTLLGLVYEMTTRNPDIYTYKGPNIEGWAQIDRKNFLTNIRNNLEAQIQEKAADCKNLNGKLKYSADLKELEAQAKAIQTRYYTRILPEDSVFSRLSHENKYRLLEVLPDPFDIVPPFESANLTPELMETLKQQNMKDLADVYKYYPELAEIGTIEDYYEYLKSKGIQTSPIFYHSTRSKTTFDTFRLDENSGGQQMNGIGVYLSGWSKEKARTHLTSYSGMMNEDNGLGHPMFVLTNIENPNLHGGISSMDYRKQGFDANITLDHSPLSIEGLRILPDREHIDPAIDRYFSEQNKEKMSFYRQNPMEIIINNKDQISKAAFSNPEKLHILGSQKDQSDFKAFMESSGRKKPILDETKNQIKNPDGPFQITHKQIELNQKQLQRRFEDLYAKNYLSQGNSLAYDIQEQFKKATAKEGLPGREINISAEQALFLVDPSNKKDWKKHYPDGTYDSFEQVFPDPEVRKFLLNSGFANLGKILDSEIGVKKGTKLFQGFEKHFSNIDFDKDVDSFIAWAQEKEQSHFRIMETLEKIGKKLYKGPPKRKDRIIDKIRYEYLPEGKGLDALTDYTRATLVFDTYADFGKGIQVLHRLVSEGKLESFNVKNRVNAGCADMLINLKTPDGYVSEIQFHTPESLIMKEAYLGNEIIQYYKVLGIDLHPIILTKEIFDLSLIPFTTTDYKILDWLNQGRESQFSFPQQNQVIYTHNLYDITRLLPQNIDDFTQKVGFGMGFNYSDVQELNAKLSKISDNITIFALKSHDSRIQ